MKQNNFFNRFFYKKKLEEEAIKYERCKSLVGHYPELRERIEAAKTLEGLLELHKVAWSLGYKNDNLAPCEYGMFRTKNIAEMKPEEVFLGNIYGLWTFPIPEWEKQKDQLLTNSNVTVYDIIVNQYRRLLRINIDKIRSEAQEIIEKYEELNPPKKRYKLW